ncbi:MAG: amidase family protein [Caldilineaceae bacterium]
MWTPAPPTSPHRSRRGAWRSAPSRRSGAVDDGEWTTQRLVAYLIRRIEELSRAGLNAVIELNPDVMADAARCDGPGGGARPAPRHPRAAQGQRGHGRHHADHRGAVAMADAHCDRDAFIVTQLCAAGAVILGKTNLSEWANYMTSDSNNGFSALGGQVHNPHGPFDVGGSSSGSGAALAAGFAPLAVGSETAGSIVSPAAQNGVVGIKPSLGLVSRDRIIPISDQMDTAGPMARCVADAASCSASWPCAMIATRPRPCWTASTASIFAPACVTMHWPDGVGLPARPCPCATRMRPGWRGGGHGSGRGHGGGGRLHAA